MSKTAAFKALRAAMDHYHPVTNATWEALQGILRFERIPKDAILYPMNAIPRDFAFIYKGLVRVYIFDEAGHEYNKIFFEENTFPGSMVALLTQSPSLFEIAAVEASELIRIDFEGYRKLLLDKEDLKLFHIYYLEQNWLIAKESREVSLVQEDATQRYEHFLHTYPHLEHRLKQYHIASHLGITPTQLSRIRKNRELSKNQPM